MYNHAPPDYDCPFCRVANKTYTDTYPITRPEDVFLQTDLATAFIAAGTWPNNPGNVLIIPNQHFENIYDLPLEYATEIQRLARAIALAMKAVYRCEGISTRQHNEPHGSQDVWHYHVHVFPRYANDDLYVLSPMRRTTTLEERLPYVQKLKDYFVRVPL